jgi:hypothetical protein
MTQELRDWFRHLAGVEAEMRLDVARYMEDDVTPKTFAVRIRTHPAIAITAAAKMRDSVYASASFGGLRVQTRFFRVDDDAWLANNEEAARKLVAQLGAGVTPEGFAARLWLGVDADMITQFFDAYEVHEKSPNNRASLIVDYVRKRNERGHLTEWNVAVVGSSRANRGDYTFTEEVVIPKIVRARLDGTGPHAADIKTLMSRRDAAVDLDVDGGIELTESAIAQLRNERASERPLLVLYPIDQVSPTTRQNRRPLDAVRDVIGFGLVFPPTPPGDDDNVYMQADLSGVADVRDDYLEVDDLSALEDEQL